MPESDSKPVFSDYLLGALSFLPYLGIALSPIVVILGVIKKKDRGWILIALGLSGFIESYAVTSSLHVSYNIQRLDVFVKEIEYYNLVHRHYPNSLQELKNSGQLKYFNRSHVPKNYFYELSVEKNTYYFFDYGKDEIPYTHDDILPLIPQDQLDKIGYSPRPLKPQ